MAFSSAFLLPLLRAVWEHAGIYSILGLLGYGSGRVQTWVSHLSDEHGTPQPVHLVDPALSTTPAPLPSIFSAATKSLSIVVPAYNEGLRLCNTLDEVLEYLTARRNKQGPQFTYEIIIVDDGSKDSTSTLALNYVRKHGFDTVRLLKVKVNRGKGHAVKRGALIARGEYVLFMDADGATKFSELEKLESGLEKCMTAEFGRPGLPTTSGNGDSDGAPRNGSKAVSSSSLGSASGPVGAAFGSRAHLQNSALVKRSVLRNFLMHGFHFCVMMVAGGGIRDTQCGFKLFTRRAAAALFSNQRLQRWCFDVELVYLAQQLGVPVAEVFVTWTEMPGSKINALSMVSMAAELLLLKGCYQVFKIWKIKPEAAMA